MRYFFHKLGKGNCEVARFLGDARAGDTGRIVIYFGEASIADCLNNKVGADAKEFCETGLKAPNSDVRVVVVAQREFWIVEPTGAVEAIGIEPNEVGESNLLKAMPVRVLVRKAVAEVPHLLASMASNAYWSRGTFREIGKAPPADSRRLSWDGWSHQFAIELQLPKAKRRFPQLVPEGPELLRLLSSVELETLVAKVFEEAGCFVPAYRGGTMADVDIIARNEHHRPVQLGTLQIPARQNLAIQVKSWMRDPPRVVDGVFFVSLNLHRHDQGKGWDAAALWSVLMTCPQTTGWLKRSLDWLPETPA